MKHLWICTVLLLAGCGGGAKKSAPTQAPVFPRVEIPMAITDPRTQGEYYVTHYWDKFDFTDTAFLAHRDVLEQALVDYLAVLPQLDTAPAHRSIARLIVSAQADTAMARFFREETEHYLWDPNSPMRHEELYIPVMETLLSSPSLDDATRARLQYRRALAQKNRPGRTAGDFTYRLADGRTGKLSAVRSEYTLLFFNNPECPACAEIIAHTGASPLMNRLIEDKRLAVLAVYTDEDLEKWRNYLLQMPAGWIVSHDPDRTIAAGQLYDLKAIPSLYLLDRDKTVILKDADIRQIEAWLQANAGLE